jgi:hypothetical protein
MRSNSQSFNPRFEKFIKKFAQSFLSLQLISLLGATEDQMKVWYTKTVFPMADPPELCMNLAKLAQDLKLNEVTPETKVPDTVKLMHQHPNLSRTEGLLYSPVHEGEIVFFPAYWFHYIHNTDLSYSITTQTYTREF